MAINAAFYADKQASIEGMLAHAIQNVPYYREHGGYAVTGGYEAFSQLPILEKRVVNQNSDQFIADGYNKADLMLEATSGTEGKPTLCYRDDADRMRGAMGLWQMRRNWIKDLKPTDRLARFYSIRRRPNNTLRTDEIYIEGNDIHIPLNDMSNAKIKQIWGWLMEFQPRWMHGPSTAIFNIAHYVYLNGLPNCGLELVELNGEFAQPEHIMMIRKAFHCPVANHYGSREFWGMGFSCPNDHIHIMDNNVFIEEHEGEVLVTTLTNKAWPLIRYRLGDLAELYHYDGSPGFSPYCIDVKRGRKADYFTLAGNQIINAVLFSGLSRGLNKIAGEPLLYQYQVGQKSESELEIKLCLSPKGVEEKENTIAMYDKELRQIIKSHIEVNYRVVEQILPDPLTGKCKDFIDLREKNA